MSKVNTVLGPVSIHELGIVAIHEHIGYGMPGSELDTQWWKTPEQAYEETVPKLRAFHEYGGRTFVDSHRDLQRARRRLLQILSAKTGSTSWPAPASSAATPHCHISPKPLWTIWPNCSSTN